VPETFSFPIAQPESHSDRAKNGRMGGDGGPGGRAGGGGRRGEESDAVIITSSCPSALRRAADHGLRVQRLDRLAGRIIVRPSATKPRLRSPFPARNRVDAAARFSLPPPPPPAAAAASRPSFVAGRAARDNGFTPLGASRVSPSPAAAVFAERPRRD